MKLPDKFKKPQVESHHVDIVLKDKDEIITVKNDFIKIVTEQMLKDIAIYDINNSKLFKFIQEGMKFENKHVIKFLNKLSNQYEKVYSI